MKERKEGRKGKKEERQEGNNVLLPILPSLSHFLCASHMSFHRVHLQHRPGGKCKGSLFDLVKPYF
jgi:hypothetical protein